MIADVQGHFDVLGTHTYVDAGTYIPRAGHRQQRGHQDGFSSTATVSAMKNPEAASLVLTTTRDVVDEFDNLTSLQKQSLTPTATPAPTPSRSIHPSSASRGGRSFLTGGPLWC